MWDIIEKLNTQELTITVIKSLYRDQEACVRIEQQLTEWSSLEKGVRQGCIWSPICFNLYIEYIMTASADVSEDGVKVNGKKF